ncbi:MAG: endonuclease [Paludibacteraceae bacterium]|nr:endonuclease [Paludibacteraceae bacterium]MBR6287510.1 endonuclease [Bacteroidaceae bacterium]
MKLRFLVSFVLVACVAALSAQIKRDYYSSVDGLKKSELKTGLHKIIKSANVLAYGSGEGHIWEGFTTTDSMGTDGRQVRDRYSNKVYYFNGFSAPSGMNIEHSFPKSYWGGTQNQAYRDLHHLCPSDVQANSAKGSFPIGVVDGDVKYQNGSIKVGMSSSRGKGTTMEAWEPADNWKGDFARMIFYMVTCYQDFTWKSDNAKKILQDGAYPTLQPWCYEMLLKWSRQDPVDEIERNRNEAVCNIQGNRNPYIDFPNLAEYVWGDSIDYPFYIDKTQTVPTDQLIMYSVADVEFADSVTKFTAKWSAVDGDEPYILNVYTKEENGNLISFAGYPKEVNALSDSIVLYGASGVVYFRVSKGTYKSNEQSLKIREDKSEFSASHSKLKFRATPGNASDAVPLGIVANGIKAKSIKVAVTEPFIISADGDRWYSELTLEPKSQEILVMLPKQDITGECNGVLTLSAEGENDIDVALSCKIEEEGAFKESFESGEKKNYDKGEIECSATAWMFDLAMLGTQKSDRRNDKSAARLKPKGSITMKNDLMGGCSEISFYAGYFSDDKNTSLKGEYSVDGGASWTTFFDKLSFVAGEWKQYHYALDVNAPVRFRFTVSSGSTRGRVNIDDICIAPYAGSVNKIETGVEASSGVKAFTPAGFYVGTFESVADALRLLPRGQYIFKTR